MKFYLPVFSLAGLPQRLKGMFNLNDPRWGRADDKPSDGTGNGPEPSDPPSAETPQRPTDERRPRSGCELQAPEAILGLLHRGAKGVAVVTRLFSPDLESGSHGPRGHARS